MGIFLLFIVCCILRVSERLFYVLVFFDENGNSNYLVYENVRVFRIVFDI